jgi:hypothetical protein
LGGAADGAEDYAIAADHYIAGRVPRMQGEFAWRVPDQVFDQIAVETDAGVAGFNVGAGFTPDITGFLKQKIDPDIFQYPKRGEVDRF